MAPDARSIYIAVSMTTTAGNIPITVFKPFAAPPTSES
jgi:hypothetical protein